MKIVDLSHRFNKEISVYPGSEPPIIEQVASVKKDGYNMLRLDFTNHTGTHLDVQGHMIENGKFIHEFPLDKFMGNGIVIDCRNQDEIGVELLKGRLKNIDTVLLYSGWEHLFKTDSYYQKYPVLTEEACDLLIKSGIKILGVDYFSVDSMDSSNFIVHKKLLSNELVLYENLCNLNQLLDTTFEFVGFPLPIEGDGVPVRAVAIIRD